MLLSWWIFPIFPLFWTSLFVSSWCEYFFFGTLQFLFYLFFLLLDFVIVRVLLCNGICCISISQTPVRNEIFLSQLTINIFIHFFASFFSFSAVCDVVYYIIRDLWFNPVQMVCVFLVCCLVPYDSEYLTTLKSEPSFMKPRTKEKLLLVLQWLQSDKTVKHLCVVRYYYIVWSIWVSFLRVLQ